MSEIKYHYSGENQTGIITTAFISYSSSSACLEIRRRGKTNNWNVHLFVDQGYRRMTGNLMYGVEVVNDDAHVAMQEAIVLAKQYFANKLSWLESVHDQVN